MAEVLARVIDLVFQILWWAILIKVVVSWLLMPNIGLDLKWQQILYQLDQFLSPVVDPILNPLRRYTTMGMIDLSPIVALIGLEIIRSLLVGLLVS